MTKKFFLIFTCFIMVMTACITMFVVKYEVVQKQEELYRLRSEIISNQKEIHILKAELTHLTDPGRLRKFAKKFTKLQEIKPYQIINLSDLSRHDNGLRKASF